MLYWLDTEFIEAACTIDLISIGIVAEDGREYYAVSSEFDEAKANDWVRENVLAHIPEKGRKTRRTIRDEILGFVGPDKPEFWGYYADYDWVVFCWLFGTMIQLPRGWPMYCRDIKQWCDKQGNPELPKQESQEHHALRDAKWNRVAWEFLKKREAENVGLVSAFNNLYGALEERYQEHNLGFGLEYSTIIDWVADLTPRRNHPKAREYGEVWQGQGLTPAEAIEKVLKHMREDVGAQ